MNLPMIYRLAAADFKERTRRYSYLVLIGCNLFLAYIVFDDKFTINFGEYKGMPNSAWTGSSIALTSTVMMCLFGFYTIKNCIKHDDETGVGQILAATRVSNFGYLFSKFLSNVLVLSSMVLVTLIMTMGMQLTISSQYGFEPIKLASPFIIIMMPLVFVLAALAILFESVKWLRGGFGNVFFFLASMALLPMAMETKIGWLDLWGMQIYETSMFAQLLQQFPDAKHHFELSPGYFPNLTLFVWSGVAWTKTMIVDKLIPLVSVLPLMLMASLAFDRFTVEHGKRKKYFSQRVTKTFSITGNSRLNFLNTINESLTKLCSINSFTNLLYNELKLMVKGVHPFWYLVALGLGIAQIAAPFTISKTYLLTASLIWPLLLWSKIGSRAIRYNTVELLACTRLSPVMQFTAEWLAGILFTMLITSGIFFGSLAWLEPSYLVTWGIVVLFIPTLALTCGSMTGGNRLFEIVYLTLWYLGPLNHFPYSDFSGITAEGVTMHIPQIFFMITIGLIVIMYMSKLAKSRV